MFYYLAEGAGGGGGGIREVRAVGAGKISLCMCRLVGLLGMTAVVVFFGGGSPRSSR